METIAVPLGDDAADRIKRVAAVDGVPLHEFIATAADRYAGEREALAASPTLEEHESMARAVVDIAAGRLTPHDEVFAKLDAKHGWR